MKKFWKITTPIIAFVLVVSITITSMTLFSKKETVVAEPTASFNGTTNIVASNSEENPFAMWELVPSADMAEIAFMYDEKEIESWEENLKSKTSEERKTYMNKLKTKWFGLYNGTDENNRSAQALTWADAEGKDYAKDDVYEECYGLSESENDVESSWKPLELFDDGKEILDVGTPGYWMRDVSMGNGDYLIRATYEPAEKYKDHLDDYPVKYKQLADYYIFSEDAKQYYGIIFEKAELFQNEDGTVSAGGQKLYVASKSWYIYNENDFDAIKKAVPNAYIYRISRENIYGAYEFTGVMSNLTYDLLELDKYYYYSVGFSYVDAQTELSANKNYYKVREDSVSFLVDENGNGVGEYAANPDAVYVKVESEKEENFVCTERECFDYVGAGNGTHCLVRNSSKQIETYPVNVGKIYYRGGFVCNRLMEKNVFHVTENDAMDFTVKTWNPGMLNDYWQNDEVPDLLYISSRSLVKEKEEGVEADQPATFSKANDISWEISRKILLLAKEPNVRLPIVVDKSIIDTSAVRNYGDANSYTNLQRLVALLCCDQIFTTKKVENDSDDISKTNDVLPIDEKTDFTQIAWDQLTYNRPASKDYGYVNNNVYVYPGNSLENNPSGTPFIFKSFATKNIADGKDETKFLEKAKDAGFGEIAEYINAENLSRKLENDKNNEVIYILFDLSITKATVVEYIINYGSREKKEWDSSIHILEIQPGGTKGNKPTLNADTIKTKLAEKNYDVEKIEITFMTTSEFVGKIENLSKYDMIYIGLDTYAFHKAANGSTVYNDTDMNGLIYSNIGDIIAFQEEYFKGTPGFTGLLESDYYHKDGKRYAIKLINGKGKTITKDASGNVSTMEYTPSNSEKKADNFIEPDKKNMAVYKIADNTYRFSGNDISKGKLEDVRDYVKAGHPVLLDSGFYSSINENQIDENKIDNCSYMWELINEIKAKENVFAFDKNNIGKTDLDKVMQYITNGKPEITILSDTLAEYPLNTSQYKYPFLDVKNGTITLEFQLTNHGAASDKTTFVSSLYLDANSDGKFSKTQEKIPATEIRMTKNGVNLKPMIRSGEDNKTEYYYEIEPGTSYRYQLSYELPTGTIGLIPWKLEVSQSDNLLRSVSKDGFFYNPKPETEQKKEINILQINTASKSKFTNNFNMEAQWNDVNSNFHKYVSDVPDFSLNVKTIPSDQFGGHDDKCPKENIYTGYEYFNTCVFGKPADMLVIGFADMFLIDNENGCMDGIVQFINEGNPVLFTHDTTSFYNNSVYDYPLYARYPINNDKEGEAGYEFNTKIRNLVGMDRYGVLTNTVLKEGDPLSINSSDTDVKNKFEEAIAQSKANNVDIGYVPKSNKTELAKQIQGFAYGFMTYRAAYSSYINYLPYGMSKSDGGNWNQQVADKVEQINSGQITNYPYKIEESFRPSPTHFQYYQLDLNEDEDEDGESDIVVWYTLGKDSSTVYSRTPRDVRNNYYIYTKGNVTYSGVGHSKVETVSEIKLYINTMIAAYHSGISQARLSLRTDEAEDADPMNVMYIAFDQTLQEKGDGSKELVESPESIEQTKVNQAKDDNDKEKLNKSEKGNTVYFTVTDKNIIRNLDNKVVEMTFGIYLTDEEYNNLSDEEKAKCIEWTEGDKKIYLRVFEPEIMNVKGGKDTTMSTGATYKAVVPPDILGKNQNHATVYVIAKVKITRKFIQYIDGVPKEVTKELKESPIAVETFRIQRIGLMDLD